LYFQAKVYHIYTICQVPAKNPYIYSPTSNRFERRPVSGADLTHI
jgi:hypothetical protein